MTWVPIASASVVADALLNASAKSSRLLHRPTDSAAATTPCR